MTLGDTLKLTLICFTLSLSCNFQYGFSSTYMNTPIDEFKSYLNHSLTKRKITMTDSMYDWIWDIIANCWFVGFFFGIWLSPLLNDKFGRKFGFISMNIVSLIASGLRFIGILVYWPELLFVGRLLGMFSFYPKIKFCFTHINS